YKGETVDWVAKTEPGSLMDDKDIAVQMRDYLEDLDYVCTYYGTGFDIPYLNTRLLIHNERPLAKLRHVDLYYVARTHLKLHSNRLDVVAESLFGESEKTRVVGPIWTRAMQGSEEDMAYIVEHCEKDVKVLEDVFETLRGFVNLSVKRWRKFGGSY
ncbi:hypothetical protein LCGC14_1769890, partial [marine sediment metagenome]